MKWGTLLLLFLIIGCSTPEDSLLIHIPKVFNSPIFPNNNLLTKEKISLGEKLFFDPRLSKNGNISCASCHKPQFAFADSTVVSTGTNGELGFRNTPSIINVAYKSLFHMDGGVRTLELQVLAPMIDTNELGSNFNAVLTYLKSDSTYLKMFADAYDTTPSIYGLTRSIASYERSLIFGDSPYDQFILGDSLALDDSQKRGYYLFTSDRLKCAQCHIGNLFSDFSFQNIGLTHQPNDSGRARITLKTEDAGKFVVPSLRNVVVTAPYMHDGSIGTLEEVILLLEQGGGLHKNKSELITPFHLTTQERNDLIHFLESLTDAEWVKN